MTQIKIMESKRACSDHLSRKTLSKRKLSQIYHFQKSVLICNSNRKNSNHQGGDFFEVEKWRSIFGSMLVKIKKKEYIFIEEHDYLY